MTYQQAMAADSRLLNIRGTLTLADGTVIPLTNEHIMAYAIDEGANEIPLGGAPSASYTLELANADGEWFPGGSIIGLRVLTGARVAVEIGVHHDGVYEYKPAGVWYVHKPGGKEGGTRFIMRGHDALLTTYDDLLDDSGFTYGASSTLGGLLNHIKTKHGLTINGTLVCNTGAVIGARPDWGAGCTVRNALSFIASAGGCFVQVDRAGALRFVPVKTTAAAKTIDTAAYLELENANARFTFNRLKVMPRGAKADTPHIEGAVSAGIPEAGNNTIVMTDNPLFADGAGNLQAMVNALTTALSGYTVNLLSYRHRGDPTLELGDAVTVTDRRAGVTTSPVLQQSIKYGAGMSATVSSMISLEMMQPSAISRNGTLSPIAFGKGSLDPSVLIAKSITSEHIAANSLTADEIAVDTIDIGYAQVKDLAAGTAIIREGIGGKLLIDRLAVSDANIVNLTAGQLIVQGTSGALYQLTVDEDGQVITELRQIGNDDIANVSLNAGEKLIKSSITADLLNVQEIFASEALIGAIKAHNIEAHSIGVDQLTPGLFESMITNATGQQLVVEFSHGTILDRERTQTIARIRVFHIGVDITDRMPDNAISWERISEDPAGDAVWNALPAHQNTKTVTINAADVNFRGVLRCKVNEARLYAEPSINDSGELIMTDYGDGDSLNFSIVSTDLIYNGNTAYEVRYGELFTDMLIGAFHLDTQMSNLKTSYVDISRHGIEMYSDGYLNLIAGSKFNMRAGSGAKSIGLSNDRFDEFFAWAGHGTPSSAPFYVKMDGTVRATKLQLNNSNITDFTQHYAYDDSDNASPTHPMLFDIFIPSEYSGIQSMKLTFKAEPFRAYSTGAASGGGTTVTSASGGGAAPTSRSGGGGTETSSSKLVATTLTGLITKSDGPGATKGSNSAYTGFTTVSSLGTQHQHTMSHTHNIDNHTHTIDAHTHGTEAHSHTVSFPAHTHIVDVPAHSHSVTLAAHTHGIVYGIYQGTTASAVQVHVDGTYIGSFASLTARDITAHLSKSSGRIIRDAWHTVTLTPNALTRLRAQVFVIGVVSQAQAAIY